MKQPADQTRTYSSFDPLADLCGTCMHQMRSTFGIRGLTDPCVAPDVYCTVGDPRRISARRIRVKLIRRMTLVRSLPALCRAAADAAAAADDVTLTSGPRDRKAAASYRLLMPLDKEQR
jgi:hypothetical protein